MSSNKMHAFDVEDAKKYSIEKAILLFNMRFWLDKNKANNHNARDGYYWTFNSAKSFSLLFPYMKEKSIARWLNELEKDGVIKSSKEYNKHKYDKTKWYTIPSEYNISQNDTRNYQSDTSVSQNDISISKNEKTIPYINTDINPNINTNVNRGNNSFFSVNECVEILEEGNPVPCDKVTEETQRKLVALGYSSDGIAISNLPF